MALGGFWEEQSEKAVKEKTREMLKCLGRLRFFSAGNVRSANYGLFYLATSQGGAWKEFTTAGKVCPRDGEYFFKTVEILVASGGGKGQNILSIQKSFVPVKLLS